MKPLKPFAKQFFGAGYQNIKKSLVVCLIVFFSLYAAQMRLEIAPSILWLTAGLLSVGIMWQALGAPQNADRMMGMFQLPFENRQMTFSLVLAFAAHTLITKTFPVLAVFYAVHSWRLQDIAVSLLCACNGCMMAAAWFSMKKIRRLVLALPWGVTLTLSLFFVQSLWIFLLIILGSLMLSILQLLSVDAYVFYCPTSSRLLNRRTEGNENREAEIGHDDWRWFLGKSRRSTSRKGIFLYLFRYLTVNRNFLLNTAILCALAVFLPMMLGQFESISAMPLGFALLSLNTPLCTLLSGDRSLEQAVRTLPGQARRFCIPYCLFLFLVNMTVSGIYLTSWQLQGVGSSQSYTVGWMKYLNGTSGNGIFPGGGVGALEIMTALLFSFQSAVFAVLLEWRYPIRSWKIESDLWHHPRKYLVPFVMILIAALVGIWPVGICIWLCIMPVEVLFLLYLSTR